MRMEIVQGHLHFLPNWRRLRSVRWFLPLYLYHNRNCACGRWRSHDGSSNYLIQFLGCGPTATPLSLSVGQWNCTVITKQTPPTSWYSTPSSDLKTVRSGPVRFKPGWSTAPHGPHGPVLDGPNSKKSNLSHPWSPQAGPPRDGTGSGPMFLWISKNNNLSYFFNNNF
jgi:hypothetical protein